MNKLFMGNIPWKATPEELRELCESFGKVTNVVIPIDRETGKAKGFAFVEYGTDGEARAARDGLDHTTFGGRPLRVDFARPRRQDTRGLEQDALREMGDDRDPEDTP